LSGLQVELHLVIKSCKVAYTVAAMGKVLGERLIFGLGDMSSK